MRVQVLAFASAGEIVGRRQQIELADGASLADLAELLSARFPALGPLWPRLALAVDGQLIAESQRPAVRLADGAEIALLPPVSGG